jgi:carboxymethylenebutenolidase
MNRTDAYHGMLAETVVWPGGQGDSIHVYLARPLGPGPFPGVVLVHHMPGWDSWYFDATRKFAAQGYVAVCPNLYERAGHGTAEDVAAAVRAEGGVADDDVLADLAATVGMLKAQPYLNGRVGLFGTCSGGRHAYLAACRLSGFDAIVDCWGGGVVMGPGELTPKRPVAPIDYTAQLSCPLLGLFGEQDHSPTPEQVAQHEATLKQHGKTYSFHMYPDAGHGFFYHERPNYRQAQAVDGWARVWAFLTQHLAARA